MLWNPYGNEGMGFKNFACVESVKVSAPLPLPAFKVWDLDL